MPALDYPWDLKIIQKSDFKAWLSLKLTFAYINQFAKGTFLVNQLSIDARYRMNLDNYIFIVLIKLRLPVYSNRFVCFVGCSVAIFVRF